MCLCVGWLRVGVYGCFVIGTRKLSITADDRLVEVYVNGAATKFNEGGWQTVRVIEIPRNTKVIAVRAVDVAKVG